MSAGSHRRCPVCPADENGISPLWEKCGCWNVPCVTGPEATDVQCRKCRRWVLFSATNFSRCAPIKKHGSGNCEARYCPGYSMPLVVIRRSSSLTCLIVCTTQAVKAKNDDASAAAKWKDWVPSLVLSTAYAVSACALCLNRSTSETDQCRIGADQ